MTAPSDTLNQFARDFPGDRLLAVLASWADHDPCGWESLEEFLIWYRTVNSRLDDHYPNIEKE